MKKQIIYCLLIVFLILLPEFVFAKVKIISRQEWGANEEIMVMKEEVAETREMEKAEDAGNEAEKTEFTEEDPEIDRVITHDEKGRPYTWPLQYAKEIKFIVLHHTGLPNELPENPVQEIRNIFRAHTLGKGWGDIGYHFLIDRKGNIYEGRKGGKFVVGGHAKPLNKVSIGISLMGNYDEEELPGPMLESLVALLHTLTKQYKIDPLGYTGYKEKTYPNIHGHEDNSPKRDPGRFFRPKWPFVRNLVKYLRKKEKSSENPAYDFTKIGKGEFVIAQPDQEKSFTLRVKNTGTTAWNKNTFLENKEDAVLPRVLAKLNKNQKSVPPGGLGIFEGTLPRTFTSGMRMPEIKIVINGSIRTDKTFPLPVMVEAEKALRVAIGSNKKKPKIMSAQGMTMYADSKVMREFAPNEIVTVAMLKSGAYRVRTANKKFRLNSPPRFRSKGNGILTLVNFENRPSWNLDLNDNQYRGILEVQKIDGEMKVINELPLEDYLKGIGEISNGDPKEKIKTIIILSRTYAKYYRDIARKFPGKPYDLDDNPDHTQKYLGYGLQARSPNIAKAVEETRGSVVRYKGKLVITPYFNQSDGRTKSALEVWRWENTPYLQSVPDTFCGSTELKGHGVGVSGCGASALAQQGKTAEEIIKYYYQGVEITD